METIDIWPAPVPFANGTADSDVPRLTVFRAKGDGPKPAMLVLPGGGYGKLMPHEGEAFAKWFAEHGIDGFVLSYRLGSNGYRHPVMLQDALRAMRTLRNGSAKMGIISDQIGVIGCSAGGHLAATLITQFSTPGVVGDAIDKISGRPDAAVLCYAVIRMGPDGHAGSRANLMGPETTAEEGEAMSAHLRVSPHTPPTFLWHTVEDKVVPVKDSMVFAEALLANEVPFAMHIYESGHHGLGLQQDGKQMPWTDECLRWLGLRFPTINK